MTYQASRHISNTDSLSPGNGVDEDRLAVEGGCRDTKKEGGNRGEGVSCRKSLLLEKRVCGAAGAAGCAVVYR